jgi:hypothetical protein
MPAVTTLKEQRRPIRAAIERSPIRAVIASRRHPRPLLGAAVMIAALASGAAAQAASPPTVSTGPAREVGYGSATLTGSINPQGSNTSYYFQYGLTDSFGGQTTIADAGAGTSTVNVRLPVGGLQPLTLYHYRLVAVNAVGVTTIGVDRTFLTTKIPLSLQIIAAPDPVLYGGTIDVQGTLSGTENANREVVLQANEFPFTAGFQDVGNPELTTATGSFSFAVSSLAEATRYRVVTTTSPPVASLEAVENVAVQVVSHIGRARRAHHARIYGTVTPPEVGMEVGILRITHGRGVLVGGTRLTALNADSSAFSRVVPVKRGVYRVLVRVTNGAQISNYGQPLLIH